MANWTEHGDGQYQIEPPLVEAKYMAPPNVGSCSVRLNFACGCSLVYWVDAGEGFHFLNGGLSCCAQHEAKDQTIQAILPLTLTECFRG